MKKSKKGQVWVETAVYTLIGITIIAVLLAIITPQIQESKDRNIIKQTINAMNVLDEAVSDVKQTTYGNLRYVDFKMAKGTLEINGSGDLIIYTLEDSEAKFSEPGVEINEGNLFLLTEKHGKRFNVKLYLNYSGSLNITFNGKEQARTLQGGGGTYNIKVENTGENAYNEPLNIDIDVRQ